MCIRDRWTSTLAHVAPRIKTITLLLIYSQVVDCVLRERLFVVGFHKRLGADKNTVKGRGKFFAWPDPVYNPGEAPVYADIAVPDSEVPYEYIRSDSVPLCEYKEPEPGKLHLIGQIGDKGNMGYSLNPAPTYSFLSLPNGQTRHNGGGRRPMQEWQQGDPLTQTRLTVPVETVRMANCPEGYGPYCKSFNPEQSDVWLRDCVNQGVPLHTGYLPVSYTHLTLPTILRV